MNGPWSATTHLLYLHGFRSSPQSFKAQRLHTWLQFHQPQVVWWCPQLPPSPRAAMALVAEGISGWPQQQMAVVGSSLGGFYARWVAAAAGCPAVLLNPAVDPARDLAAMVGVHSAWHDPAQRLHFEAAFIDELRALQLPPPAASTSACARLLAIIAKGDEVLDWREMAAHHAAVQCLLLEGGDHGLTDFEAHLPLIAAFLGW